MKIAQGCPHCKEFFVTEARLETCPFCEKELPKKEIPKSKVMHPSDAKLLVDIFGEEPSTDLIKEFVGVKEQVSLLYNLVYGFLSKNNDQLKSKSLGSKELCDFGFISRELENVFDELRKEVKARKELCGQIIAFRLIQASVADPTLKMQVQGQFASGTPNVKMEASLPKKFTEEYYQLTDYFGVPRKVAEAGILKLDWKTCSEFLTKQMQDGKRIPDGFGKQYPKYVTTYRRRKEK